MKLRESEKEGLRASSPPDTVHCKTLQTQPLAEQEVAIILFLSLSENVGALKQEVEMKHGTSCRIITL